MQRKQLTEWCWAVHQKSLSVVDAHVAHLREDAWLVYELSNRLQANHSSDLNETPNRGLIKAVIEQVTDELAVDFEVVDREGFQVSE